MNTQDKQAAQASFNSGEIDQEFLPYLDRINRLSFAATKQCCVGHME